MDKKLIGLVAVFIMVFGVFMTTLLYSGREGTGPVRAGLPASCVNSFPFTTSVEAIVGESVNQLLYVRDDNNTGLKGVNDACIRYARYSCNQLSSTYLWRCTTHGIGEI